MAMTDNDIECELSYAYLHAVAARARLECSPTGRISDNHAVDATLRMHGKLAPDFKLAKLAVDIQLKSTSQELPQNETQYSFKLPKGQYDKLRACGPDDANAPMLLVLFVMPHDPVEWLTHSVEGL